MKKGIREAGEEVGGRGRREEQNTWPAAPR